MPTFSSGGLARNGLAGVGRTKNLVDSAQARVEPSNADGVVGKVNEAKMRVGVSSSRVSNAVTYSSRNVNGIAAGA